MNRKPMSPGDWVIAALFAATIVVVTAQVVWRYAFNNSLVWTEELSRYLFVWMTFLGAALAVKESSHIRVTLLVDCLPARVRRWLTIGCLLLTAAFLAFLAVVGLQWVRLNANTQTPALGLPLNYVLYASLPAASLVGLWFALVKLGAAVRQPLGEFQVQEAQSSQKQEP